MQPVEKIKKRQLQHGRLWLLAALLLALGAGAVMLTLLKQPDETIVVETRRHGGVIHAAENADVAGLRISLRSGDSWQLTQDAQGALAVDGDASYQVASSLQNSLLNAAAAITYEDILTEDAAAYAENFADFGLDQPRIIAEITYRDGKSYTLRIGDSHALEDSGWCYMMIDGDPRLYALDQGTADNLTVKKDELHPVTQPVLHKARFDRITFTGADGQVQARWALRGDIGGDAQDRWLLTEPLRYPCDGESIGNLHSNLANVRLGVYVAEATAENLQAYGFDAPRFVLEVHMAAGSIGTTNAQGVYEVTDWPEETFTLTVGAAKNDAVDYVRVGDQIYLTSHFTLRTFMDMQPADTLTRYPAPVALGNLAQLTIWDAQGERTYRIERTERVAENNELVTDVEGNVLYDTTCTLNGQAITWSSFEAAYNTLLVATVSGTLPEGWTPTEAPHSSYTFTQFDGTEHTLALAAFDALHDAVILDGNAVFYLIKGGLDFPVE